MMISAGSRVSTAQVCGSALPFVGCVPLGNAYTPISVFVFYKMGITFIPSSCVIVMSEVVNAKH